MSAQDQWFPLCCGDYLRDTMGLTTIQHGAYILLLMDYWTRGPLPHDEQYLASVTKTRIEVFRHQVWPTLAGYFTLQVGGDRLGKNGVEVGGDLLHQKRMDMERDKRGKAAENRHSGSDRLKNQTRGHANFSRTRARASTTTKKEEDSVLRTAPAAPVARLPPSRFSLFLEGLAQYRRLSGAGDRKARRRIGQLLRDADDDCQRVMEALFDCPATVEPDAWLTEAVKQRPFLNGFLDIVADEGFRGARQQTPVDAMTAYLAKFKHDVPS